MDGRNGAVDVESRQIVTTRDFAAPRELVFDVWTSPEHVGRWFGPRGFTLTTRVMDVRPGGEWRFVMHGPDGTDFPNLVRYHAVQRPSRLEYQQSSGAPGDAGFEVVVTFEDLGGSTRVTLRSLFPTAEARDFVVEKYGAIEGAHQTLERFDEAVASALTREFRIARTFDAPRDLVYRAWTERDHLVRWWGPKGFGVVSLTQDLRPGGTMHYGLRMPNDATMWGKWTYREIVPGQRLVFVSAFSDENAGVGRHPLAPEWPAQFLTTVTFEADGASRTTVTVHSVPYAASESERRVFDENHASMTGGWGGTFDQLGDHLAGH